MSQPSCFFHQWVVDCYGAASAVAVAFVLERETEFNRDGTVHCERDPADPGGTTMYGIDAGSHPGVDVPHLSEAAADDIYHGTEWTRIKGDQLPSFLALPMLDTAVNPGWKPACTWLQEALGVNADGFIGSVTTSALSKLDGAWLLRVALAVQDKREAYYRARPALLQRPPLRRALSARLALAREPDAADDQRSRAEPRDRQKLRSSHLLQICYEQSGETDPIRGKKMAPAVGFGRSDSCVYREKMHGFPECGKANPPVCCHYPGSIFPYPFTGSFAGSRGSGLTA